MPLNHPSVKKDGNTKPVSTPQNYVVEDATNPEEYLKQFEAPAETQTPSSRPLMPAQETFDKARATTAKQRQTVDPETRKKLENIIFLGRLTKTIEIAGQQFELSTLTNREQNEVMKEVFESADGADLFKIRVLSLANGLKTINGIKLDDFDVFSEEEEAEFSSAYKRRQAIVDNLQLTLVERLYDEYNSLLEENEQLINGADIKK